MGLPEFKDGLLVPGPYAGPIGTADDGGVMIDIETFSPWAATLAEIEAHFVGRYPNSTTRELLWGEVEHFVAFAHDLCGCALFWISGEFVADRENPADAHLSVILLPGVVERITEREVWLLTTLLRDRTAPVSDEVQLTSALSWVFPVGHVRYEETLRSLATERHYGSHPLGDNRVGGYAQVTLCDGGGDDDAQILDLLAGAVAAA